MSRTNAKTPPASTPIAATAAKRLGRGLLKAKASASAPIATTSTKRLGRGLLKDHAMSLRATRMAAGVTQTDVATTADIDQAEVSRLEQRNDAKLSTLRRYLRALGADLELTAVFPKTGHRIRIAL